MATNTDMNWNFSALIREKMRSSSLREAAEEIKTSPATLSRILSGGKDPDVKTFSRIILWLDPGDIVLRMILRQFAAKE